MQHKNWAHNRISYQKQQEQQFFLFLHNITLVRVERLKLAICTLHWVQGKEHFYYDFVSRPDYLKVRSTINYTHITSCHYLLGLWQTMITFSPSCLNQSWEVLGEGSTKEEAFLDHDNNFHLLKQRYQEQNIKLNQDKVRLQCMMQRNSIHRSHDLWQGLQADPNKVKAVLEMLTPTYVARVQRFIGYMNYLSKILPWPSDALEPLHKLTLSDMEWFDSTVQNVKLLITNVPVLKNFDSTETITLQCDTSDKGAGAVLLLKGSACCLCESGTNRCEDPLCPDWERAVGSCLQSRENKCLRDKCLWNWTTSPWK